MNRRRVLRRLSVLSGVSAALSGCASFDSAPSSEPDQTADGRDNASTDGSQPTDSPTTTAATVLPGTVPKNTVDGLTVTEMEVTILTRTELKVWVTIENVGSEPVKLGGHNYDLAVLNEDGEDVTGKKGGFSTVRAAVDPGSTGLVKLYTTLDRSGEPTRYEVRIDCEGSQIEGGYCE